MSEKGQLEQVKQIFNCVVQENIAVEEMGVINNFVNHGTTPRFVDTADVDEYRAKHDEYMMNSPLMKAAEGGHVEVCSYLIKEQNANLEARNVLQQTALIVAAHCNRTEVINVLLENGANVKALDKEGRHAACLAASNGNLDVLKMVLAKDESADRSWWIEDTNWDSYGRSPWMEAARAGHSEICNYLIKEKNVNLEKKDEYQNTALILAAREDKTELLKVLLDNNADIKAKNRSGSHAAFLAAENGYLDSLKLLVAKDRSVIDLKGPYDRTPLISAAKNGMAHVVRFLVEQNADVNSKDNEGKTALQNIIDTKTRIILMKSSKLSNSSK